jgi:hypothetical protein
VKHILQQFIEDEASTEFCCYCCEPKGDKLTCCQENHFIPLSDFDQATQMEIAKDILDAE